MDMMSLLIKIGADDKEAKEAINNFRSDLQKTGRESDGIFSKLKTAFGTVGKAAAAGFTAAGGAIIGLTKSIVDAYGDYEQLTGGVETLFKGSADTVMEYANNAFKTAGLSANQYMETVTSFSSSLIQSTGRGAQTDLDELKNNLEAQYDETKRYWQERIRLTKDSGKKASLRYQMEDDLKALKQHNKEALEQAEQMNQRSVTTEESLSRAAKLADVAISDMADNANKMGSSMESIQTAYAGFAKQNYTMLDNLKLGGHCFSRAA